MAQSVGIRGKNSKRELEVGLLHLRSSFPAPVPTLGAASWRCLGSVANDVGCYGDGIFVVM